MEKRKHELSVEDVRKHMNNPDLSDEEAKEIIATLKELAEIAYIVWQESMDGKENLTK